jgi:hypothetical protein
MSKMSEIAITECVLELRAACRRPINQLAIDTLLGWVRPDFERILDRTDGKARWAQLGPRVRETGRHLGALADFFASHTGSAVVGHEAIAQAATMVRADCTVRGERTPMAYEFCPHMPLNMHAAQEFLRTIAPVPELSQAI